MYEPLLHQIEDLERSRRRWKTAALVLASLLVGVLLTFGGLFVHERFTIRNAMLAAEEARAMEAVARAQAQAARQAAEVARQAVDAQQNQNKK